MNSLLIFSILIVKKELNCLKVKNKKMKHKKKTRPVLKFEIIYDKYYFMKIIKICA